MKPSILLAGLVVLATPVRPVAAIQTDWAYHSAGDQVRVLESVPGETVPFLANGSTEIPSADTVTLYVLTARNFAGNLDEQVFVRWWDGAMAHWIMGAWLKNITLSGDSDSTRFRQLPASGSVQLDLWKVDIPPWITQPGQNFYAVQLKGLLGEVSEERYLVWKSDGGFSRTNHLGQIWSASEEIHGQDWPVTILP